MYRAGSSIGEGSSSASTKRGQRTQEGGGTGACVTACAHGVRALVWLVMATGPKSTAWAEGQERSSLLSVSSNEMLFFQHDFESKAARAH